MSLVHARVGVCKVVSRFRKEDTNANADKTTHTHVHICVRLDLTHSIFSVVPQTNIKGTQQNSLSFFVVVCFVVMK